LVSQEGRLYCKDNSPKFPNTCIKFSQVGKTAEQAFCKVSYAITLSQHPMMVALSVSGKKTTWIIVVVV
jgi:hypothetical protein